MTAGVGIQGGDRTHNLYSGRGGEGLRNTPPRFSNRHTNPSLPGDGGIGGPLGRTPGTPSGTRRASSPAGEKSKRTTTVRTVSVVSRSPALC